MTVEQSHSQPKDPKEQLAVNQVKEIAGVSDDEAWSAFRAGNSNIEQAIAILTDPEEKKNALKIKIKLGNGNSKTDQPANAQFMGPRNSPAKNTGTDAELIDLTKDKDDDLEKAIALSLQDHQVGGITAEEEEISRALEASLAENNKSGLKRKRGEPWLAFVDPVNPHERERIPGCPVGLKNVGNTCWFSAVVQSLFHIPLFRKLVLEYHLPQELSTDASKCDHKLIFMKELQSLFALLVESKRKYVDPIKAVEILKEALNEYNGSEANPGNQQDVSEFTHKLIEWLEDAFRESPVRDRDDKQSSNPMIDLFYGQCKVEGIYQGNVFNNHETFGAFPLRVQNYSCLHDSLEGALAQGEIEPVAADGLKSGQEHWFTRLPAVLTFELSRFHFNQAQGRAEKIHDKFRFDKTIFMDRYMEHNKEITRSRREEVKKLKDRLNELQASHDRFMSYGSSRKVPVPDMLDSMLDFVRSTPAMPTPEIQMDVEMDTLRSDSPMNVSVANSPITTTENILSETRNIPTAPSPRLITEQELNVMQGALKRWKGEVEQDLTSIREGIQSVNGAISNMYSDSKMKQHPYRLHAVMVHEGQASGGHYWAYIYDPVEQQWRKYNDITVHEVTWEEVERESLGGYRHVSAYCLMYVDVNRQQGLFHTGQIGLPMELQKIVQRDNESFAVEISEWDEKQTAKAEEKATATMSSSKPDMAVDAEISSPPRTTVSDQKVTMVHKEMQSPALSRFQQVENVVTERFNECKSKFVKLSAITNTQPRMDPRLQSLIIYMMKAGASEGLIDLAILELMFKDVPPDEHEYVLVRGSISERMQKLPINDLRKWSDFYHRFLIANTSFLQGLSYLQNENYQEALPYFLYSMEMNSTLPQEPNLRMNTELLAFFRRLCIMNLNNLALKFFEHGTYAEMCEGLNVVIELVVPTIPTLMNSEDLADGAAAEEMRDKWFAFLGGADLEARRQEKLQDFLPKLLDCNPENQKKIICPHLPRNPPIDLCDQFSKAMEFVNATFKYETSASA